MAAFWCLGALLRSGTELNVAYGIWSAAGVAATALLSAAIFDEHLTDTMPVGLVVIVIGVLAVETGSHRAHASREEHRP